MKNKVYIKARRRENYGDERSSHWKLKGTTEFVIEMDADLILYDKQLAIDMFRELVETYGNSHESFEYMGYRIEFHEPIDITKEFEKLAREYNDV